MSVVSTGGAGRPAVDALGGLRGDDRARAVADRHVIAELVAAGDAAGGIDEDRLERRAEPTRGKRTLADPDW